MFASGEVRCVGTVESGTDGPFAAQRRFWQLTEVLRTRQVRDRQGLTPSGGKYPPAKPGALDHEPPEAVDGVADAAPEICTA